MLMLYNASAKYGMLMLRSNSWQWRSMVESCFKVHSFLGNIRDCYEKNDPGKNMGQ